MIVGGFHQGRFLSDTYAINFNEKILKSKSYVRTGVFLYQMPIVYDTDLKTLYFCEALNTR